MNTHTSIHGVVAVTIERQRVSAHGVANDAAYDIVEVKFKGADGDESSLHFFAAHVGDLRIEVKQTVNKEG